MKKLLIVEDSHLLSQYLAKNLQVSLDIEIDIIETFQALKIALDKDSNYDLALLDIHLSDMYDCELIDYVLEHNIPSIIMTGNFQEDLYSKMRKKDIVDFVLKDSVESIDYIISLTKRLFANMHTTVMVVDDSPTSLIYAEQALKSQLFTVTKQQDPFRALERLRQDASIKLVITDYNMPSLNGVEFLKKIRLHKGKNELGVIGMSADTQSAIKFLKFGANDFINKPFSKEEFIHRVNNLMQNLENIEKLLDFANNDFLTKVANRKYFFEHASKYHTLARKKKETFAIAMIDIDNFKNINDTYGHDIGDIVIKQLANTLKDKTKGQDIVSRFGGEEFCVLLKDIPPQSAHRFFEDICQAIASIEIPIDDTSFSFTVSIGLTTDDRSLEAMIKQADCLLYEAKNSGKNRIVSDCIPVEA